MREDITVLVAGAANPMISAPNHPRWIELGWHDYPGDVLAASDVYVLSNRMTYYDLVLIEALSMKTPVVASATGGNKSIATLTDGAINLFDGSETDLLDKMIRTLDVRQNGTQHTLKKLDDAYQQYFTPKKFAARYESVIRDIYSDYKIGVRPTLPTCEVEMFSSNRRRMMRSAT